MIRTKFDETRDQRIAIESGADLALMCRAPGCPNRWSVDGPQGRCCSAHAWVSDGQWPQITAQQQDAETQRAWDRQQPQARDRQESLTRQQKVALLQSVRGMFKGSSRGPREWAHELRRREQAGELLPQAVRDAWRSAIGAHGVLDTAKAGGEVSSEDITEALQITGDIGWPDQLDIPAFDEPGMSEDYAPARVSTPEAA